MDIIHKYKKYIGKEYNNLKVTDIKFIDSKLKIICECKCGSKDVIIDYLSRLINGRPKSCGCLLRKEKHGLAKRNHKRKSEYHTWSHIKQKCTNQNSPYFKDTVQKGITMCERWLNNDDGFQNFLEDMGERPGSNYDFILKNNTKEYNKNNCQWILRKDRNRLLPKADIFKRKYDSKTFIKDNNREYNSWLSMKSRCLNKNNPSYKYYGGRGIIICERWLDIINGFKNFLDDMGPRPKATTLDRRDTNGNYEPGNCKWSNKFTQARVKRKRKDSRNKFKGILKQNNKFYSVIRFKGNRIVSGPFNTEIQAALSYDQIYERLFPDDIFGTNKGLGLLNYGKIKIRGIEYSLTAKEKYEKEKT